MAARTRFIASYVSASTPTLLGDAAEEENVFLGLLPEGRFERSLPIAPCISALMSVISSTLFDHCLTVLMGYAYSFDDSGLFFKSCNECEEASACAMIKASFMFAAALLESGECEDRSFIMRLCQIVIISLMKNGTNVRESSEMLRNRNASLLARVAWLNSAHSAVLQFLQSSSELIDGDELSPAAIGWMKSMCYIVLSVVVTEHIVSILYQSNDEGGHASEPSFQSCHSC